jgi:hypothetical protein
LRDFSRKREVLNPRPLAVNALFDSKIEIIQAASAAQSLSFTFWWRDAEKF